MVGLSRVYWGWSQQDVGVAWNQRSDSSHRSMRLIESRSRSVQRGWDLEDPLTEVRQIVDPSVRGCEVGLPGDAVTRG